MRILTFAAALALTATPLMAQDADRSVEDGGIHVDGWELRIDARARERGATAMDSRLAMEDGALRFSVGPAGYYWNPAHTASGDYEVSAVFHEHAMSSDHPHPYGMFIGGSELGTDGASLLYCTVYADGTFIVRAFNGAEVQRVQDKTESPAIVQAGADGEATNTIGWRVRGGTASCMVNGTEVASFPASAIAGMDDFDGVFGVRVSHNLELTVRELGKKAGM